MMQNTKQLTHRLNLMWLLSQIIENNTADVHRKHRYNCVYDKPL